MSVVFSYTARNRDGEFISGSVESDSRAIALRELLMRQLIVTSMSANALPSFAAVTSYFRRSERARIEAIRMLSILLSCGISAKEALQTCALQSANAHLREALSGIIADLDSGLSFSSALAKRPGEFDRIGLAMLASGEKAGTLVETLARYAELLERKRRLRARVISSLTYPALLFVTMVFVVVVLSINIVPAFTSMFVQMHVQVPPAIRYFTILGASIANPFIILFALAGGTIALLLAPQLLRSRPVRTRVDTALRSAPVIGKILQLVESERLARMLASMLKSGVPIREACAAAIGTTSSITVCDALRTICREVDDGSSFTNAVVKSGVFDGLFTSACRIGESTGKIDELLLQIAEHYDFELGISLDQLSAALEPTMIILLGSFLGFIVISLIVPLYTMIGSIR
ncbi:MAG: type II secretion system F family protein [Vulcanimicrobiaceae bacterium]